MEHAEGVTETAAGTKSHTHARTYARTNALAAARNIGSWYWNCCQFIKVCGQRRWRRKGRHSTHFTLNLPKTWRGPRSVPPSLSISDSLSLRFLLPPSPHSALSLFHTYACVRIRHFPKTCQYRNGGGASDGRRERLQSERKSWSGTESVQLFTNVLRGCKCNCTPEPIRPRHRPRPHPHHRVVIKPGAAMPRRSLTWSRRGVVGLMKCSHTPFPLRSRCATRTDRPAGTML